jgi:hypothetical protein
MNNYSDFLCDSWPLEQISFPDTLHEQGNLVEVSTPESGENNAINNNPVVLLPYDSQI